ncbi:MAG: choice-of-anchor tandem repeat GloVer-containing protein [Terriglobales bacterium]|jgi:uncharacterized repeat protein (TIGR03803 family)
MRAKGIVVLAFLLFSISSGWSSTQQVLYTFTGGLDGGTPYLAGVTFDQSGNLYGVTQHGGAYGMGTVYQLTPSPTGPWTETVIYNFIGSPDGAQPQGGLVFDELGNLYGTAAIYGPSDCGTLFKLSPSESGWTFTILHAFTGGKDGCNPQGDLYFIRDPNFGDTVQGTTADGGRGAQGAAFEIYTSGTQYSVDPFLKASGIWPGGLSACGFAFCGTASTGGKGGAGTLFFWYGGDGNVALMHAFTMSDKAGYSPMGDLTLNAGLVYGTTAYGGVGGYGAVYQLTPVYKQNGMGWKIVTLHGFSSHGTDGYSPWAGVIFDGAGNLYGTTQWGGTGAGAGTVYRLTPGAKNKWSETLLYSFNGEQDGGVPTGALVFDNAGNLYGTTSSGGAYNQGVVYKVTP